MPKPSSSASRTEPRSPSTTHVLRRREADRGRRAGAGLLEAERAARVEIERIGLVKDEFLATLSHELRTPLNAVLGWSGSCYRGRMDPEVQRGLETIARNARAQARLIDDLLDMNRIVSGKIRLDVQRLELAAIVEAALDSVRPSVEAKSISVRRTIDPSAGLVFGDPDRLQQVVWNLLTNAVKFTPKGGKMSGALQRVDSARARSTCATRASGISAELPAARLRAVPRADSGDDAERRGPRPRPRRSSGSWSSSTEAASGPRAAGRGRARRSPCSPLRAVRDSASAVGRTPDLRTGVGRPGPAGRSRGSRVLVGRRRGPTRASS